MSQFVSAFKLLKKLLDKIFLCSKLQEVSCVSCIKHFKCSLQMVYTLTFRKFVKLYTSKISYNILAKNIYVRINQCKRVQFTAVKPFECYHCKLHTLELQKKMILFKKPYLSFSCFGRIFAAQQLIPVRRVFILLVLKSSSLFWFQFLSNRNYLNGSHTLDWRLDLTFWVRQ